MSAEFPKSSRIPRSSSFLGSFQDSHDMSRSRSRSGVFAHQVAKVSSQTNLVLLTKCNDHKSKFQQRSTSRTSDHKQINRKLLSDIQIYHRQIRHLTFQKAQLHRRQKASAMQRNQYQRNFELMKNRLHTYKPLIEHYQVGILEDQQSIIPIQYQPGKKSSQSEEFGGSYTSIKELNSSAQIRLQQRVQQLESQNANLQQQNTLLKQRLVRQGKPVQTVTQPRKQTRTMQTQTEESEQAGQKIQKARCDQMTLELERLRGTIKDMEKKHKSLKDRCVNIKSLLDAENSRNN